MKFSIEQTTGALNNCKLMRFRGGPTHRWMTKTVSAVLMRMSMVVENVKVSLLRILE